MASQISEQTGKPTRARLGVLALISATVTINYLDRALLGIASPSIQEELALSPAMMGFVLSAFSWTYFLSQIPCGILLDRFKTGLIYGVSLVAWSLVTALHALIGGIASLIGLRFALGLAEAPCFPANNKVVSMWFPRSERARAIAVYTAAEYIGLSFLSPILFWILYQYGWRTLFTIAGLIGVVYGFYFLRKYRDPHEHPTVNQAELDYIAAGGGVVENIAKQPKFEMKHIAELFQHRQMWGLCIGQFAVYSTFVFFLTWFPTYLATERQMSWIKVGIFTALPYIAGFFGILFAGWWSDWMLKRGVSLNTARKLPVIAGLLGASTIMLANFVDSNVVVVCILSLAFFCQAMSSSGWAVLSEISPKERIGLVGGLFSASANLSGIVIPLVIGFIVQATGSFVSALVFISAVALIGAFSWIFLIGDLKPMVVDSVKNPLARDGTQVA
jgi:MFS transporter, ACS family, D-galactonate transporter